MRQQLIDLRARMKEAGVSAYIIPTTDFHGSEYVNDYFKCRKFVSGFTGSAGTLAVTEQEAFLWTDGRYFLQAANQLDSSGIGLMKSGQPGVPSITEYLADRLTPSDVIGFDGRVVDYAFGRELEKTAKVNFELDLVCDIWKDRPALSPSRIYSLPESVTGESAESKLERVRSSMRQQGADYHLITSLEDIAWLLNLRGRDVENTPVFFSFALINADCARLYVMDKSFEGADDWEVLPYFQIFKDIKKLPAGSILLDEGIVSYALIKSLPEDVKIINSSNPAELMKSLKNDTELAATENAHLKDGAAMLYGKRRSHSLQCHGGNKQNPEARGLPAGRFRRTIRRRHHRYHQNHRTGPFNRKNETALHCRAPQPHQTCHGSISSRNHRRTA